MKQNIFELSEIHLREIVTSFQEKFEEGLQKEKDTEIQCLPTYITPKPITNNGKALVLDLGGTKYRAAIVRFADGESDIRPKDGWNTKINNMKTTGYTREALFREQADLVSEINPNQSLPIGYCFSYPAESMLNGDAKLLRWTKGVNIEEMIGQPVGKPLLYYMNERKIADFTSIKVINDTVASLFAGLTNRGYDAYIGLIVGTGTNMATFIPREHVKKTNPKYKGSGLIPVNLESGNFHPPHLTILDNLVDELSDSRGRQRFEKAVSGMYLGELFKAAFPSERQKESFTAEDLNHIINHPELYKKEYVNVANRIFNRSAQLVAASLAGLILVLLRYDDTIRRISLTAEGSVFWSKAKNGRDYNEIVMDELKRFLGMFNCEDIQVEVEEKKNANLIGTAIAALS